jgi:uncharacterized membrane protein
MSLKYLGNLHANIYLEQITWGLGTRFTIFSKVPDSFTLVSLAVSKLYTFQRARIFFFPERDRNCEDLLVTTVNIALRMDFGN